jgi:2-phosphoglycerate kinase
VTERRRHLQPLPLGGEDGLPFSKGLMARALIATGVPAARAYELALRIETDLAERGREAIELERLYELASETLGPASGDVLARLRRYAELQELDLPIIVLVGGGTGTGKSSVATEVAYRLGITRVTSTDFVRQTMRAFFSKEFMPSIHYSSFEAGDAADEDEADPVLAGFLDQTRNVLVGVRAALDRVLQEGWSMVLEGVHLVPGMLPEIEGALVVQCVLGIDDLEAHASHFWSRDNASEARPFEKYLDAFDDIRHIHDYILKRAAKAGVPVVENAALEPTVASVIGLVLAQTQRVETVDG